MKTIASSAIRAPAVAGMFYPGEREDLVRAIEDSFSNAASHEHPASTPKAIIAPHAGYIYSGSVAASVYALLAPARTSISRVVLLGPTHRVAIRGLALPEAEGFATPLGIVEVDQEAVAKLRALPQVTVNAQAHALEHSLEVHLPFLQTVLATFTVVPLAVGHAEPKHVAQVLDMLWGGSETLIVVSSDLSHYLSYRQAQAVDKATADAIMGLNVNIGHAQACGATPVAGLALVARQRNLRPALVDLRNSGDTAGDKSRVVGYGSFAFFEISGNAS